MMAAYAGRHEAIVYHRSDTLIGIDEGYDLAVSKASGEYCWMMTDDDLIEPHTIDRILTEIDNGYEMILVNLDCFTRDLSASLEQKLFQVDEDKVFGPDNMDEFYRTCGVGLTYIACIVLKRDYWFERGIREHYGSFLAHVVVILESRKIKRILLISDPYIRYRAGNSSWTPRSFEIWNVKWPKLVWEGTSLTEDAKASIVPRMPWKRALTLLKSRAVGEYDLTVLNQFLKAQVDTPRYALYWLIAVAPRLPLNFALLAYCLLFRRQTPYTIYNLVISNPHPEMAKRLSAMFGLRFTPEAI
jgi:hypothetical protein